MKGLGPTFTWVTDKFNKLWEGIVMTFFVLLSIALLGFGLACGRIGYELGKGDNA